MAPTFKNPPFRPFVCLNCQLRSPRVGRQSRHFAATPRSKATSQRSQHLRIPGRTILRLNGPDAALFLHNLIPAKILETGSRSPIYTAFLSAHGRILNDVFIYPPSDSNHEEWFVEVDSESAGDLLKHLRKHKLRAKFQLERMDDQKMGVFYSWPTERDVATEEVIGGQDPRPGMGRRWLDSTTSSIPQQLDKSGSTEATMDAYIIHRMLNGVAEGQSELIPGSALPQESNIDFVGGIDFFKGCYLGQELTIRTHHTGVVRKRILPCQLYEPGNAPPTSTQALPQYRPDVKLTLPPPGSNISKAHARGRGRSSGKWLGGVGNVGLALCRLEMMTDIQLTADRTNYDPDEEYKVQWEEQQDGDATSGNKMEVMLKPFVPPWIREGVEQSLRRKEKKVKPRQEEEDEEELD